MRQRKRGCVEHLPRNAHEPWVACVLEPKHPVANYREAEQGIADMIHFYNHIRPHMSIGMMTPMEVYLGGEPGKNLWKKKKVDENQEILSIFALPNNQGGDSFMPSSS